MIEIDGGACNGSIEDGVYRVNVVVEGGDDEIGSGRGFDSQNRKLKVPHAALARDGNQWRWAQWKYLRWSMWGECGCGGQGGRDRAVWYR